MKTKFLIGFVVLLLAFSLVGATPQAYPETFLEKMFTRGNGSTGFVGVNNLIKNGGILKNSIDVY